MATAQANFSDATVEAGIGVEHALTSGVFDMATRMATGMAAVDYNADGWVDLYVERGSSYPNALFRNNGDGTFTDVATAAGVALHGRTGAGVAFADLNGDGWPDLVVGGVQGAGTRILLNRGNGTFADHTAASGLATSHAGQNDFSHAFADIDKDGDLDMFISHWGFDDYANHLWVNDGSANFSAADAAWGLSDYANEDFSFTPNFADLNNDGWVDLAVAGDFGTSRVFVNDAGSGFIETTDATITDENGMGAAIADFNNDGIQDWFVSSIWDPNGIVEGSWGQSGNRLYFGNGDGTFTDATDLAGVRHGYWGWGSCAQDFDNNGWMDIFHVNGWGGSQGGEFLADPSRLFMNQGGGVFAERSVDLGIDDTGQGRGVACFDYDQDGDVDIFLANNHGAFRLYRNELQSERRWLQVLLEPGTTGMPVANSIIRVTAGSRSQRQELIQGNHYESQSPMEAHFGLPAGTDSVQVDVIWPDGQSQALGSVVTNQRIIVVQSASLPGVANAPPARPVPLSPAAMIMLALLLILAAWANGRLGTVCPQFYGKNNKV